MVLNNTQALRRTRWRKHQRGRRFLLPRPIKETESVISSPTHLAARNGAPAKTNLPVVLYPACQRHWYSTDPSRWPRVPHNCQTMSAIFNWFASYHRAAKFESQFTANCS